MSAAMLDPVIAFTGSPLDRAGPRRQDAPWLAARLADPASRFLLLNDGKALIDVRAGPCLAWRGRDDVAGFLARGGTVILLGLADGNAHFAVETLGLADPKAAPYADWGKFIDAARVAGDLKPGEAAIVAQARALVLWHARHRFCAVCGAPTEARHGGHLRQCTDPACATDHFPRTDPVVIMLVLNGDDCLLGRGPGWPDGNFSALAGFVEPGESIEEAVRREVAEEAGLTVGEVRYAASQPWPYPSSLMIGCVATATNRDIVLGDHELAAERWFSRAEIGQMLDRAESGQGLRLPPRQSLAHQLAARWLAGDI